jgi:hypothetical protein
MALPLLEPFTGGAGVLGNPPWTQQHATTVNYDGSGRGKASAANASDDLCAFDNSNTYSNAQYAQQTIVSGLASAANYAIACVRCSGTGATKNNYYLATDGVNGTTHTSIGKYVSGAQTELLPLSPAAAFTSGDVMRITVSGTTLTAYKNGVAIGSTTDSSLASGAAGCGMYNQSANNILLDTWQGGNVAPITITPGLGQLIVTGFAPSLVSSASAVLSGTVTASITESDIVAGGKTIVLTVSGTTWIP